MSSSCPPSRECVERRLDKMEISTFEHSRLWTLKVFVINESYRTSRYSYRD